MKKVIAGTSAAVLALTLAAPALAGTMVVNNNGATVTNTVDVRANTGMNRAGGATGGNGGDAGDIRNWGDDVKKSDTGNGGNGGDAGPFSGGVVQTGNAAAVAEVGNEVNHNRTWINSCGCEEGENDMTVVRNRNRANLSNGLSVWANTGKNGAGGASGGEGGEGGNITNNDQEEGDGDVENSTTGNGGHGGNSGEGGAVMTGESVSGAGLFNVVNRNVTRIRPGLVL